MDKRIEALAVQLAQRGLDWVALNPGPSLQYLTGLSFHLMERPVVVLVGKSGQVKVLLPELERAKVADLPFNAEIITFGDDPASWQGIYQQALSAISTNSLRVGVEPTRLRFLELDLLREALPKAEFVDGSAALAGLRMRKGDEELKAMRQAAIIAQNALLKTLETVKPGQSELQISAELMVQLFRAGSEAELPFAPIVSTGPNSANPHASPTDRVLQEGEMLLIDWGASFAGYFSDITRTFFCGEPNDEMKQIADLVEKANAAARLGGKAGMPAGEVDKLARDVITQGGYGAYFTHRTGHGLGMEAHEAPYVFHGNPLILEPGMVFTIEPGIYLPGKYGVRIEDDVVVEGNGLRSLTDLPREVMRLEEFLAVARKG
ncbi:MAG TPA: Xaa-Pro peptidase family protein [Anaerolineaceae bacterium]|nr:Xaa-Pro peptidase family protein [Anaerolineaceae bacterium]